MRFFSASVWALEPYLMIGVLSPNSLIFVRMSMIEKPTLKTPKPSGPSILVMIIKAMADIPVAKTLPTIETVLCTKPELLLNGFVFITGVLVLRI